MSPRNRRRPTRPGATLPESAIVLSVTLLLLFGAVLGGLAVSCYQAVVVLAEEMARAGAVRGGQYRERAGLPAGTTADWSADLYAGGRARFPSQTSLVDVGTFGLDPARLRVSFAWSNNDNRPLRVVTDNGQAVRNTFTVRVEYDWAGGIFDGVTFRASSQTPIMN